MTLSKERLEEIAELARKATYKPCAMHMTNLIAACDSEVVEALARELLALRKEREAAVPVAWRNKESGWCGTVVIQGKSPFDCGYEPLYAEPPTPVVPDAIEPDYDVIKGILPTSNPDEYACCIAADMWNACRAAMLNQAPVNQPASNSPEIPDGYALVPIEPTGEMYDAGDRQPTTKQVWDAMIAAAPKQESE